jgi:hypothetical protein
LTTYRTDNVRDKPWHVADTRVAESLFQTVTRINTDLSRRRADDALFLRMYGDNDVTGKGRDQDTGNPSSLKFNLCRAGVNTAQAHIGALRPKAHFLTDDADWSTTRKAKSCDLAVAGVFHDQQFYDLAASAFLDGAVSSLGGVKAYRDEGKIQLERVFPGEILIDAREGYYGKPRNLYQIKLVSAEAIAEKYPQARFDTPKERGQKFFDWLPWSRDNNEFVVVEAWHLPRKGKGGRHVIAIENRVLKTEKWTRNSFPFAFFRWEKRQFVFFGRGIVEELRTHQRSLNYIDLRIRDAMHYLSRGKLIYWESPKSKVNVEQLTTAPWDVLKVHGQGQAPTVVAHNAIPTEWWLWRRQIIEDGLRQIGFNEFQVSATKPPGIEAGVALRELRDEGTRRARQKVQMFEQFVLDTARLVIEELQEGAEAGDLEQIQAKARKGALTRLQMIDWREVALERDQYQLTVSPASSLPDTTAGRFQTVQDWYQAGFISQIEAKALLDLPDLERFNSLDLAPYEIVCDAIERMIEDGEYVHPEPTDDLELAEKLTTLSLAKFRLRRAPDDRLELLRRYLDAVGWLQEKALQGASEIQQMAAQNAEAVAGVQGSIPGPTSTYEAARVAELGLAAPKAA